MRSLTSRRMEAGRGSPASIVSSWRFSRVTLRVPSAMQALHEHREQQGVGVLELAAHFFEGGSAELGASSQAQTGAPCAARLYSTTPCSTAALELVDLDLELLGRDLEDAVEGVVVLAGLAYDYPVARDPFLEAFHDKSNVPAQSAVVQGTGCPTPVPARGRRALRGRSQAGGGIAGAPRAARPFFAPHLHSGRSMLQSLRSWRATESADCLSLRAAHPAPFVPPIDHLDERRVIRRLTTVKRCR